MKTFEAAPANEFFRVTKDMFKRYKKLAEDAIQQLDLESLYASASDTDSNSVAILMQHIGGNLHSRFTDFLISDGEKKDRQRDQEFEGRGLSEVELWAVWEKGFAALFQTLDSLNEGDFSVIVYIRKEPHSVPEALLRSLSHIAYHVGQIVYIAKNIQAHEWKNLSIPKGESEAFSFTAKKKKK